MEFLLNEDQQMIHDLARDFAQTVLAPRIEEIEAGELVEVSTGEKLPQLPTTSTCSWLSAASSASPSPRSTTAWAWATLSRPSF